MSNDTQIARTILQQLGGNKFTAMTGSHSFVNRGDGLSFQVRRNKAKATHCVIALRGDDTYTVEFWKLGRGANFGMHKLNETAGAYAEDLQRIFTEVTGLDTHL